MKIPFTKAHGAKNDFLLTWKADAPPGDLSATARAICDRHTGIGADGWILVSPGDTESNAVIELYNSDGSAAEISGNGTRCAAAFLIQIGCIPGNQETLRIGTGAGVKTLRLLNRFENSFSFEMNMGAPIISSTTSHLQLSKAVHEVSVVWVGNPQCVAPVENFDFDWRAAGAEIERHSHFPNRTNVSFIRRINEHEIEVRFWERGAGETMSSATGSTGAVAAAIERGMVTSPVRVSTPAGVLELCWKDDIYLIGPAAIIAEGLYFHEKIGEE